jgi:hypothetical protein
MVTYHYLVLINIVVLVGLSTWSAPILLPVLVVMLACFPWAVTALLMLASGLLLLVQLLLSCSIFCYLELE